MNILSLTSTDEAKSMMGVPPYAAELSESALEAMDLDLEVQLALETWLPGLTDVIASATSSNLKLLKKAATFTLGELMFPPFQAYVTAHELDWGMEQLQREMHNSLEGVKEKLLKRLAAAAPKPAPEPAPEPEPTPEP